MSTATTGRSKDAVARRLAESHYRVDPSIKRIFRIVSRHREQDENEPIKLLEVNEETTMSGIVPIGFGPHEPSGIFFRSIIVEVRPEELERIRHGEMPLPKDWEVSQEYCRPEQT